MIKVVLCGYRDWANEIIFHIKKHRNIKVLGVFSSQVEFLANINSCEENPDIILFLGWSWIIPAEITEKFLCLGIHPSDLPNFRGGSPIQNQIIAGINKTKVTLMTLSSKKLDAGEIWLKEDLDLSGSNISKIFIEITKSSIKLLNEFFSKYPNISPIEQDLTKGSYFKRRKPEESRLDLEDFRTKSMEDIYNFIRCLTDPYPNAYIEDKEGNKLVFKQVEYFPTNSNSNKNGEN